MDFKRKPKIKRVTAKKITPSKKRSNDIADTKASIQVGEKLQAASLLEKAELAEKVVIDHTKKHFLGRIGNLRGVRNLVFLWLFMIISLLFAVGFSQYFGRLNYTQEVFSTGGTYSEGIVGEINSLNPVFASTEAERSFSRLAFSRLTTIDSSGSLKNELADKISNDDNHEDFTVDLRQDATWSDGEKLDADDVIFTVNLLKDRTVNPSQYLNWRNINVEKTGDYAIKFELPSGARNFAYSLNFPILPEHKLKDVAVESLRENSFSENPVTSGAFNLRMLQKIDNQKVVHLEANNDYFLGRPKVDRFEIRTFSDESKVKEALLNGEILASPNIELSDFSDSEQARFNENKSNLNRGVYAFLNEEDPILKNKKVRSAIQQGVDVSSIRSQLGSMTALDFPVLNGFLDDDSNLNAPTVDKEAAKKSLDDDGWKIGKDGIRQKGDQKLSLNLITIKNSYLEKITEGFSSQLKDLGFEVNTQIVDPSDSSQNFIQSILQPRAYSILVYEIDLGADPDIFAFWHSSQATTNGYNLSNYKDTISDDILASVRSRGDDALRQAKFESFIKRWLSDAPAIGVVQSRTSYVYRNSVKPYNQDNKLVESLDRYSDVIYWQAAKSEVYKTP